MIAGASTLGQSMVSYIEVILEKNQFLVPIIALFKGWILDKPEEHMIKMKYLTGGRVEHEVSIISQVFSCLAFRGWRILDSFGRCS